MRKTFGSNIGFRVDKATGDWLEADAEKRGILVSQAARDAIAMGIEYCRLLESVKRQVEARAILEGITREELVARILSNAVEANPVTAKMKK